MSRVLPILTVLAAIVVLWYGAAVWLNSQWTYDQAARAGAEPTFVDVIADTMAQERPVLPAPHQVVAELWGSTGAMALEGKAFSKRS
ncbi:MAG: ABC transporter permease, partial [Sphingomonadales bacterium]|nr:ABC transporter permease [Sphingomonadales bacterium]